MGLRYRGLSLESFGFGKSWVWKVLGLRFRGFEFGVDRVGAQVWFAGFWVHVGEAYEFCYLSPCAGS